MVDIINKLTIHLGILVALRARENFTEISEKIIPFFQEHKIVGVKALDFEA